MSTLRINNIEAQSVPASPTIDEKVKVTNSSGDILVNIDGKTSGITTIGINTTDGNIKFDANSNVLITGILTATTLAGNFTPDSLEIGSNIKLGNAGVITATNFKSGVTNVHNLGVTLTGGQLDVGSNIKLGTAGIVTATSFVGSGANLTSLPAQATIANNADNRVITGGSGVNLNGESNLTFNGQKLNIAAGDGGTDVKFAVRNTNANGYGAYISGGGNNNQYILRLDDKDQNEYMRVTGIGHVGILNGAPQRRLHVGNSGNAESNIRLQGGADYAELRVKDSDNSLSFHVNMGNAGSVEKLKIQQNDATLYGQTDGVLNITTTDSRGSFIRFQESGTTKVWVGCGQGLSLGAATDLGLRATNDIRMRSGSEMHAVLTADGYFAAKGMAGSWTASNTDPASSQYHQFTQTGNGKRIVVFRQEHHSGLGVHIEMSNNGNQESLYCTGTGGTKFRVLNNGSVGSANNSYGGISDIKLKENIVDANSQWNDIKAVKVRNFNFKDTPDTKMLGVVAQEIETISPGLVSEIVDKDPNTNEALETTTKEVKYSILYMKAIKCLQEAQARIETLEAKVAALEGS